MIKSFASREMAELFAGRSARRISGDMQCRLLQKVAALWGIENACGSYNFGNCDWPIYFGGYK
jgi:hypothetical protein